MKRITILLILLALSFQNLNAQENRREKRAVREREKAEEIFRMAEEQDLRFIAQLAYPMSGGSIHLSSEYTMDIVGDSVSTWLPYYGRAYKFELGNNGGIKIDQKAEMMEWKTGKKGVQVVMEVKDPRDLYKLNLQFSSAGYATLDVYSNNRQSIRFSGIITRRPSVTE